MDSILKIFPELPDDQLEQLRRLGELYIEWNAKINLISRKDIENIYAHHILHSLSIHHHFDFIPGTRILDLGTGGGLPGIPMAIVNPNLSFLLVDGRSKKIMVVNDIIQRLGLKNVKGVHKRAEEIRDQKFDFVITRAVAKSEQLLVWTQHLISRKEQNIMPNGIIALKGLHLRQEIKELPRGVYTEQYPLKDWARLPWYEEKSILYIQ